MHSGLRQDLKVACLSPSRRLPVLRWVIVTADSTGVYNVRIKKEGYGVCTAKNFMPKWIDPRAQQNVAK